jgi:hypothetical protein
LISSSYQIIDENGKRMSEVIVFTEEEQIRRVIYDYNPFCHGAAVFRKQSVDLVGGYREFFKYAQDYDLWMRISEKYGLRNIGEILYLWRKDTDSVDDKRHVEQFQYAMVAIQQARKRGKGLVDEIDGGVKPSLPAIEKIGGGLKNQLLHSYFSNMIVSFRRLRIGRAMLECKNYLRAKYFSGD